MRPARRGKTTFCPSRRHRASGRRSCHESGRLAIHRTCDQAGVRCTEYAMNETWRVTSSDGGRSLIQSLEKRRSGSGRTHRAANSGTAGRSSNLICGRSAVGLRSEPGLPVRLQAKGRRFETRGHICGLRNSSLVGDCAKNLKHPACE